MLCTMHSTVQYVVYHKIYLVTILLNLSVLYKYFYVFYVYFFDLSNVTLLQAVFYAFRRPSWQHCLQRYALRQVGYLPSKSRMCEQGGNSEEGSPFTRQT